MMDEFGLTLEDLQELLAGFDTGPDFSDQEWDALCEYTPMTQSIFDSCVETCAVAGDVDELLELFARFPEQGKLWYMQPDTEWPELEAILKAQGITETDAILAAIRCNFDAD